jgi:hypothetical protein
LLLLIQNRKYTETSRVQAILIDLHYCPTLHKPGKRAAEERWQQCRKEQLLEDYVWRYQVKVNWREGKTLTGMDQLQAHIPVAEPVPAFITASCAMLSVAVHQTSGVHKEIRLWIANAGKRRQSRLF